MTRVVNLNFHNAADVLGKAPSPKSGYGKEIGGIKDEGTKTERKKRP